MEEIKSPADAIKNILEIKRKRHDETKADFEKLVEYMKPFIADNEEIGSLIAGIHFNLGVGTSMDDLILISVMHAQSLMQNMMMPKTPLKIECPNCKTVVYDLYDLTELEKMFAKK